MAYLTNSHRPHAGQMKNVEFSRATVNEPWSEGVEGIRRSIANFEWTQPALDVPGIRVSNLPPVTPAGKKELLP